LISFLDEQGTPQIVERGWIMPPYSAFSPLSADERKALMSQSIIAGIYERAVDRDSAYEMLQRKVSESVAQQQAQLEAKQQEIDAKQQAKEQERLAREQQKADEKAQRERDKLTQDVLGTFAKSAARSLGGPTGQRLVRGLLGSLFGKR
ncbi:MAG: helicase HerA-like domain-containing protein, partial [Pseudomonadota bacterium]|nr:helicase HerA-like domain-containing protein [Pseudomonadota bacterium]